MRADERHTDAVDWGFPVDWSHPLNRGLVSWWLAVPNRMGYGTFAWRDLCGRNHGTLTGGPTWGGAAGRPGGWGAMTFDGSDDYIAPSLLLNTAKVTLSAWVEVAALPGGVAGLVMGFMNGLGSGTHDKELRLLSDGRMELYAYDGGPKATTSGVTLSTGTWYHVAGVADGTNLIVYLNGTSVASTACGDTYTGYSEPNVFVNGENYAGAYGYLNALIDDARIYNRGLSAPEVRALYLASAAGYPYLLNRPRRRYYVSQASGWGQLMGQRRNRLVYAG